MAIIKFRVDGLPPKKDGANSMWGNRLESERLVNLRKAALRELKGRPPLKSDIKLAIAVHVGLKNNRSVGDLDTFITGVCDGLMRRARGSKLCEDIWNKPENSDVHPDKASAIDDDSQVMSIQAVKIVDDAAKQFYDVTLEGE